MRFRLVYPESYLQRARKFLRKHPEIHSQYQNTLRLLEIDPLHPSLRFHRLQGPLSELASVSINMNYRIVIEFLVLNDEIILVNVGDHGEVY